MTDLREHLQAALGDTYTIERELGGGGMASVFLAQDLTLGRSVVIKVPAREAAMELSAERFAREVRVAARLNHPNIVPVLAAGEAGGVAWYSMPFVGGQSLRHRLETVKPLPLREAVAILTDVARALEYAHAQGVVHRDIKPENVLLAGSAATVTDFGIAKAIVTARESGIGNRESQLPRDASIPDSHLPAFGGRPPIPEALTALGQSIGTPAYMAPEQALGDPSLDPRADLYAWGCLAYEVLTGTPPFTGEPHRVLAAHVAEAPRAITERRPDVPHPLADLVMACLAKEPRDRPPNATAILDSLGEVRVSGPSAVPSPAATSAQPPWFLRRAGIATGAVAVLAAGWWAINSLSGSPRAVAPTATADSLPSVAVLDMRVTPDTAGAYLGEGMADEITVALQRLPGIRVASRATVRSYVSRVQSLDSLAQLLRVRTLLTGTIRRIGNAYQVTAELTEAGSGTAVWAERFQRNSSDLFALQEDVARAIVNGLEVRLAGAAPSAPRGTTDAIAYDLYLRGHAAFQRRGRDGVTRAIAAFDSATRRDPRFARAWGALALAWSQAPGWLFISVDSAFEPTRRAASQALAIDRSLGDAHAALGYLAYYRWEWAEAERLLRQAIANDPSSASAPLWLGELLSTVGRTGEAVTVSRHAWELEPLNATVFGNYAYALLCDGRVAEAIEVGERARDTDPSNPLVRIQLATAYAAAGRSGDAEREMASPAAGERAPKGLGVIAAFYAAQRGDRSTAERIRRDVEPGALDHQPVMRFFLRAALGDTAGATAALDEAVTKKDVFFIRVKPSSPVFDSFRSLPRFQAAMARAGLDTTRFRPRTLGQTGRTP